MTNKKIRKHARELYRRDFWRFLLAYVLTVTPTCVNAAINLFTGKGASVAASVMGLLILTAAYPLSLGEVSFFFNEFHGSREPVKGILRFYRDNKQLMYALGLGAIINTVNFILGRAASWFRLWFQPLAEKYAISAQFALGIGSLVGLLVFIAQWIVIFRMFLARYIYVNTNLNLYSRRNPIAVSN